jgi:hypothetical protein
MATVIGNQQQALALHRSVLVERIRKIAKAGIMLDRMEAVSYHWDQLNKKLVEVGSSKTGEANIDQSLVIDTILAAIDSDLVHHASGVMTVDKKVPPLSATLDLLDMTAKRAIHTPKELIMSKGASQNAKWSMILKWKWKGHWKITPATKQVIVHWI